MTFDQERPKAFTQVTKMVDLSRRQSALARRLRFHVTSVMPRSDMSGDVTSFLALPLGLFYVYSPSEERRACRNGSLLGDFFGKITDEDGNEFSVYRWLVTPEALSPEIESS
jgi:hypothetical protein